MCINTPMALMPDCDYRCRQAATVEHHDQCVNHVPNYVTRQQGSLPMEVQPVAKKYNMTPAEFAAATREFETHFNGMVHQTSGTRSTYGNAMTHGNPNSKHLVGMAKDYRLEEDNRFTHEDMQTKAAELGLSWKPYDWGIHLQGLLPGPIPNWWSEKYIKAGE